MIGKDLDQGGICRTIAHVQELICDLIEQNNVEIPEEYYLKKAFNALQEVFETQFDKWCKLLGVNENEKN